LIWQYQIWMRLSCTIDANSAPALFKKIAAHVFNTRSPTNFKNESIGVMYGIGHELDDTVFAVLAAAARFVG